MQLSVDCTYSRSGWAHDGTHAIITDDHCGVTSNSRIQSDGNLEYDLVSEFYAERSKLGRKNLAEEYGLKLPETLEDERRMWEALTGFIIWGNEAYTKLLDEYRAFSDPIRKDEQ